MTSSVSCENQSESLFCVKPFLMLDIKQSDTAVCCWVNVPSWSGPAQDMDMEQAWNSHSAQAVRRSIHDGSFKYCTNACPFLSNPGKVEADADILHSLQILNAPVMKKADITEGEMAKVVELGLTKLPYKPKAIECGFDASCNLSCPSCREEKIVEVERKEDIKKIQQMIEKQALSSAEMLYITGSGDPFGSPYFRQWLKELDQFPLSNLNNIHFHTNAMLWNEKAWLAIPEKVRALVKTAEVTIDAASDATYAENRRGGNFERLLQNMAFICDLRRNGELKHLKMHMVVQKNNYHEMPEFVALGNRFRADVIYFSRLEDWGTFAPRDLLDRQIHLISHPLHVDFLHVIKHPVLRQDNVFLGNLFN